MLLKLFLSLVEKKTLWETEENVGINIIGFSTFPTMFSKGIYFMVIKSWDCVVKS